MSVVRIVPQVVVARSPRRVLPDGTEDEHMDSPRLFDTSPDEDERGNSPPQTLQVISFPNSPESSQSMSPQTSATSTTHLTSSTSPHSQATSPPQSPAIDLALPSTPPALTPAYTPKSSRAQLPPVAFKVPLPLANSNIIIANGLTPSSKVDLASKAKLASPKKSKSPKRVDVTPRPEDVPGSHAPPDLARLKDAKSFALADGKGFALGNHSRNDAFVSYSRKDKPFAVRLVQDLGQKGRQVWVDWEDIPPGTAFENEIHAGIEAADAFVICLSPDWIQSYYCNLELRHAVRLNKKIVPIVCRSLGGALPPSPVDAINWVYMQEHDDWDAGIQKVLETLDTDLEARRFHTTMLVRALDWKGDPLHQDSLLLTGAILREASEWIVKADSKEGVHGPAPTQLHREFITASQLADQRRKRRIITYALLVLLIVAMFLASLGLAIYSGIMQRRADDNAATAEQYRQISEQNRLRAEQRQVVSDSIRLAVTDLQLSLLLAVRGVSPGYNKRTTGDGGVGNQAASSLRSILQQCSGGFVDAAPFPISYLDTGLPNVMFAPTDTYLLADSTSAISVCSVGPRACTLLPKPSTASLPLTVSDLGVALTYDPGTCTYSTLSTTTLPATRILDSFSACGQGQGQDQSPPFVRWFDLSLSLSSVPVRFLYASTHNPSDNSITLLRIPDALMVPGVLPPTPTPSLEPSFTPTPEEPPPTPSPLPDEITPNPTLLPAAVSVNEDEAEAPSPASTPFPIDTTSPNAVAMFPAGTRFASCQLLPYLAVYLDSVTGVLSITVPDSSGVAAGLPLLVSAEGTTCTSLTTANVIASQDCRYLAVQCTSTTLKPRNSEPVSPSILVDLTGAPATAIAWSTLKFASAVDLIIIGFMQGVDSNGDAVPVDASTSDIAFAIALDNPSGRLYSIDVRTKTPDFIFVATPDPFYTSALRPVSVLQELYLAIYDLGKITLKQIKPSGLLQDHAPPYIQMQAARGLPPVVSPSGRWLASASVDSLVLFDFSSGSITLGNDPTTDVLLPSTVDRLGNSTAFSVQFYKCWAFTSVRSIVYLFPYSADTSSSFNFTGSGFHIVRSKGLLTVWGGPSIRVYDISSCGSEPPLVGVLPLPQAPSSAVTLDPTGSWLVARPRIYPVSLSLSFSSDNISIGDPIPIANVSITNTNTVSFSPDGQFLAICNANLRDEKRPRSGPLYVYALRDATWSQILSLPDVYGALFASSRGSAARLVVAFRTTLELFELRSDGVMVNQTAIGTGAVGDVGPPPLRLEVMHPSGNLLLMAKTNPRGKYVHQLYNLSDTTGVPTGPTFEYTYSDIRPPWLYAFSNDATHVMFQDTPSSLVVVPTNSSHTKVTQDPVAVNGVADLRTSADLAALSDDASTLAYISSDKNFPVVVVQQHAQAVAELQSSACALAGRDMSDAEWAIFSTSERTSTDIVCQYGSKS